MNTRQPDLSIVVVSTRGPSELKDCLERLAPQSDGVEVIVARAGTLKALGSLPERFAGFRFVEYPPRLSLPLIRFQALKTSRGRCVALTKDSCRVAKNWCRKLRELHHRWDEAVIGGALRFGAPPRGSQWAAFLCEYWRFLPELLLSRDPATANVSYKKELLEAQWSLWEQGRWETLTHRVLEQQGAGFRASPELWVEYKLERPFGEFLRQRYLYSCSFAEMRVVEASPLWRLTWFLGSPLIPFLLLARMTRALLPHRKYRWTFFRSLPWLFPLLAAGAWGELCGYLRAGDSGARVD
ncbi:MAG: glycosyltransferase family 2 protein [Acidobacteriota bacterium]